MATAIRFENLAKQYRLGEVSTGALSHDWQRAWAKLRGRPDPFAMVGNAGGGKIPDSGVRDGDYIWALRDISFDVQQGEMLGIIGHNGAGKSTLLKLLSRVTAPTIGYIKAKGRIASLLEVGTGFHPELTGRENIYLNGAILGMMRREIAARLDEIIDFSGCEQYIDTPVKRYSTGMLVRLGFSVGAHLTCQILVVDEVLAVGDADFQSKCVGKMQGISDAGRTVLFVSHNMSTVQSLCTRAIVLNRGKFEFSGATSQAIQHYLADDAARKSAVRVFESGNIITKCWSQCLGSHTSNIPMGVDFELGFSFDSDPISRPGFGLVIEDAMGRRVTSINNHILKQHEVASSRGGNVEFAIRKPNLNAGTYFVSFVLTASRSSYVALQECALTLTIHENDVYGTGNVISKEQGIVFLDAEIRLSENK